MKGNYFLVREGSIEKCGKGKHRDRKYGGGAEE
jgi:hypothetical protein